MGPPGAAGSRSLERVPCPALPYERGLGWHRAGQVTSTLTWGRPCEKHCKAGFIKHTAHSLALSLQDAIPLQKVSSFSFLGLWTLLLQRIRPLDLHSEPARGCEAWHQGRRERGAPLTAAAQQTRETRTARLCEKRQDSDHQDKGAAGVERAPQKVGQRPRRASQRTWPGRCHTRIYALFLCSSRVKQGPNAGERSPLRSSRQDGRQG